MSRSMETRDRAHQPVVAGRYDAPAGGGRFQIDRLPIGVFLVDRRRIALRSAPHRVGYEDVSRFGRHFKRRFGATPGAARS